jgi:hypothetical protein
MKKNLVLLIALALTLIPISTYGTDHAGPKTPSCGNYKVTKKEVIVGVKFPKGTYQVNAFGIPCSKVMGKEGLFSKFLKLKDRDPLPKPWRYLAGAVGAPKFSSSSGVGFRVQLLTPTPSDSPSATPSPKKIVPDEALVVQALFEEIWKSSAKSKTKVKIEIEPARKDSDWAKQQVDLTDISLELFVKMGFDIKTESTIYIGWDWNWIQQYMPKQSWCYTGQWAGAGSCGEGILFINLKYTADSLRSGDKEIPFPSKQVQFGATSVMIHELAHQAQRDFAESNGKNVSFYPAWIREGAAELLKIAGYAKYHGISYIEARDLYLYTNYTFQGCGDAKILEMLMSNNHPRNCNYTVGMLAVEYLAATKKDLRTTFTFAGSKLDGLGPNFNNQTGISEETYRLVMKEVFNLDISVWDPLAEKYYGTWAP